MSLKFYAYTDLVFIGKHLFGLAHAASGYHRVLEENRRLYNQVQDLKGDIANRLDLMKLFHMQFSFVKFINGQLFMFNQEI